MKVMTERMETRTINSALWAAAGDALGFITELTDEQGLRRRLGAPSVSTTASWRRSIGGKFGTTVTLPAGCYSDDTQLRLSTCRAIRSDGQFDVEAFAKVELPVWLAYAIGGGVGTKAAANSLAHQDVSWFSNFFEATSSRYVDAGGNGAAMRVQPHVWAARSLVDPPSYLTDVIRNAVCSHGHVRGIFGAIFHAFCLAHGMQNGEIPGPDLWKRATSLIPEMASLVRGDPDLSSFWLPSWEAKSGVPIEQALDVLRREFLDDISILDAIGYDSPSERYPLILGRLGCLDRANRGAGLKTSLAAAWLAWASRRDDLLSMLLRAANVLSSDTDTLATMAGAISGACAARQPDIELMDRDYIESEAVRLSRISRGEKASSFTYPDLFLWKPPRTQLDAVGMQNGHVTVAGLGDAVPIGQKYLSRRNDSGVWQWLKLHFGQTVLIKQRSELAAFSDARPLQPARVKGPSKQIDRRTKAMEQSRLFTPDRTRNAEMRPEQSSSKIDELTGEAIRSGFDPSTIGRHILDFADQPDSIERAAAYAAIIVKAKRARKSQRVDQAKPSRGG